MPVLTWPIDGHHTAAPAPRARVALLGLGTIGAAVADRAAAPPVSRHLEIAGALVRHPARRASPGFPIVTDPADLLRAGPDVVVEVLGGLEPARTYVLAALERGIPVVTANKSLIARHADELHAASRRARAALRYEASVLAGVPFLGTFARRPLARSVTRIAGILNGTSNFVLTRLARDGDELAGAIESARRAGYAEADPTRDLDGTDAAEKLAILVRLVGGRTVDPDAIPRAVIVGLRPEDFLYAAEFGGTLKPVAVAGWDDGALTAFVGPCFVPLDHPLARLDGVANGLCLSQPLQEDVVLIGPGAGPRVTAATVLDDVLEVLADGRNVEWSSPAPCSVVAPDRERAWFVRVEFAPTRPDPREVADLLGSFDVWLERTRSATSITGGPACWLITHPAAAARLSAGLEALSRACGCATCSLPVLERSRV